MSSSFRNVAVIGITALVFSGCTAVTGRTAGQFFNDKTTQAGVKARLATLDAATLTRVNVNTYHGTIYLTGVVDTDEQRRAIETHAAASGPVVNNIQVRLPEAPPRAAAPAMTTAAPQPLATAPTAALPQDPAASPQMTMPHPAGHRLTGEVARVDEATGRVEVRAGERTYALELPLAAAGELRPGDRITVDMNARVAP